MIGVVELGALTVSFSFFLLCVSFGASSSFLKRLPSYQTSSTPPPLAPYSFPFKMEAQPFNFLVMGDWGGSPTFPYTTGPEIITAKGMGEVGTALGSKYAMALGDNFYTHGVTSLDDHRWNATFENVFTADNLQTDDFFRVLLGNHDHYGNTDAQIQYSNVSARWRMDDLYWSYSETTPDGIKLDTIMIDTVVWAGASHVVDEFGNPHSVDGDQLPGPADQVSVYRQNGFTFDWRQLCGLAPPTPTLPIAFHLRFICMLIDTTLCCVVLMLAFDARLQPMPSWNGWRPS